MRTLACLFAVALGAPACTIALDEGDPAFSSGGHAFAAGSAELEATDVVVANAAPDWDVDLDFTITSCSEAPDEPSPQVRPEPFFRVTGDCRAAGVRIPAAGAVAPGDAEVVLAYRCGEIESEEILPQLRPVAPTRLEGEHEGRAEACIGQESATQWSVTYRRASTDQHLQFHWEGSFVTR